MHSVLHPVSPAGLLVSSLWWWMLTVACAIYALVGVATLVGIVCSRRRGSPVGDRAQHINGERAAVRWVAGSGLATVCVSGTFLLFYVRVENRLAVHPDHPLTIAVVGHQWWWEVAYPAPDSLPSIKTANEIHIPVGEPIAIDLRSNDVIHSFWVPSVGGKEDLIPGEPTRAWIEADTPGVYVGQCSQFCGRQHAHMALSVIAEPRAQFDAWLAGQRQSAVVPSDSLQIQGRGVFLAARCASCHTIQGTSDVGDFGPNLTHLASRSTIAARTIANSRDHLIAWILNPESFKPGALMPANPLDGASLRALTSYLGALK
jgi:cytochrome c oxidase subunit 2